MNYNQIRSFKLYCTAVAVAIVHTGMQLCVSILRYICVDFDLFCYILIS